MPDPSPLAKQLAAAVMDSFVTYGKPADEVLIRQNCAPLGSYDRDSLARKLDEELQKHELAVTEEKAVELARRIDALKRMIATQNNEVSG